MGVAIGCTSRLAHAEVHNEGSPMLAGTLRTTLLLLCLAIVPTAARAQVVLTEDFETPDTGNFTTFFAPANLVTATNTWTVTQNSVDLFEDAARAEAVAFDGGQAVDLTGSPGPGVMETTFGTEAGAAYELSFHYARNNLLGADTGDAEVEVLGKTLLLHETIQHDPAMYSFDTHVHFTGIFVADSTDLTLRFTSFDDGNAGVTVDAITITEIDPVSIGALTARDREDRLLAAQPNPFQSSVAVHYSTSRPGPVDVTIYDVRGRRIRTLTRDGHEPGVRTVSWDGTDDRGVRAAPGVYLCVLLTPQGVSSRRVVLLD